jgi:NADH:ubiquinone oxidoreductase subunit K
MLVFVVAVGCCGRCVGLCLFVFVLFRMQPNLDITPDFWAKFLVKAMD